MIYWCMLIVTLSDNGRPYNAETAVKGTLIRSEGPLLYLNFKDYATKKGYAGNWDEPKAVLEENCVKD